MSVSPRSLLVLAGVAFLLFAGIVLNAAIERDALSCGPERCVAQRDRGIAFGGPSGSREFRPRDVKRLELVAAQMRYGSVWVLEIAEQDDLLIRLEMSDVQANDLRRWFDSPSGNMVFEGPRATRNYPFVALLAGIGVAAFVAAAKQGEKGRDEE